MLSVTAASAGAEGSGDGVDMVQKCVDTQGLANSLDKVGEDPECWSEEKKHAGFPAEKTARIAVVMEDSSLASAVQK